MRIDVRPPTLAECEVIRQRLFERWGAVVVSRGRLHPLCELPVLVALNGEQIAGCLTYRREAGSIEIITLDAFVLRQGVGTALLQAALALAPKVWLVTTNDNLPAQALYHKLHGRLVATTIGAVQVSRRLKPTIPECGYQGIPINDELLFEWGGGDAGPAAAG